MLWKINKYYKPHGQILKGIWIPFSLWLKK